MNQQQAIALAYPCELPQQCADQRYRAVHRRGRYYVSVIVTVNVGEE